MSVEVPGTDQLTDTGIDLGIDDTVSIEADGEITPSTPNISVNGPNGSGIDPATLAVDRLFEVFNAQDAEGVAGVFGDDVAFTLETGEDVLGADAAAFWQGYFGLETGERLTDAFHAADGLTYFMAELTWWAGGSTLFVFDVEMDGEQLIRMGARPRNFAEVVATRKIDNLYEAFNDQDLERLTEEFEGITYTSPSGAELEGAEAAEHWADEFGSTITRTSGVFAIGDGPAVLVTEHREPAGPSTGYVVEVETSRGQITSITERRPET